MSLLKSSPAILLAAAVSAVLWGTLSTGSRSSGEASTSRRAAGAVPQYSLAALPPEQSVPTRAVAEIPDPAGGAQAEAVVKDPDPAADSGTGAMAQARPLFVPADCPRSGRISTVPAALAGLPSGAGFGDGHAALAETLAEDFAGRLEAAPASPESDEDYRVRWDVEAWYSDYRYKLLFGRHAYVRMNLEAEQRATGY